MVRDLGAGGGGGDFYDEERGGSGGYAEAAEGFCDLWGRGEDVRSISYKVVFKGFKCVLILDGGDYVIYVMILDEVGRIMGGKRKGGREEKGERREKQTYIIIHTQRKNNLGMYISTL